MTHPDTAAARVAAHEAAADGAPADLIVAAAQFAPVADGQANLARIAELAETAARRGARLVVFPEYSSFFTGRPGRRMLEAAEAADGPFTQALADLADRHGLVVVAGLVEKTAETGRFASTVVAVAPRRGLVATYRKQHLYDAFGAQESRWVRPGALGPAQVFPVAGLRVGLQSCYDLRFPEITRTIVDAGAEVILMPAEWVPGPHKADQWRTLLAARAIENTVFLVGAGQTAPGGIGCSAILDPSGVVLAQAQDEPGLAVAGISARVLEETRRKNPSLRLRRYAVTPAAAAHHSAARGDPTDLIPE